MEQSGFGSCINSIKSFRKYVLSYKVGREDSRRYVMPWRAFGDQVLDWIWMEVVTCSLVLMVSLWEEGSWARNSALHQEEYRADGLTLWFSHNYLSNSCWVPRLYQLQFCVIHAIIGEVIAPYWNTHKTPDSEWNGRGGFSEGEKSTARHDSK